MKLFKKGKPISLLKLQTCLYKQPFMIGLAIYASVGHEAQEQNQDIYFR